MPAKKRSNLHRKNEPQPQLLEDYKAEDHADSDEEISEDGAFNSDDERRYGSFFSSSRKNANDEASVSSRGSESDRDGSYGGSDEDGLAGSDDEDDDGDGGQFMLNLLESMDATKNSRNEKHKPGDSRALAGHVAESPYAASVLSKAELTLESLMQGLEDTAGYGNLQRSMSKVAQSAAITAPLSHIVSIRKQRQLATEVTSQDISAWLYAVQQNRQAETLDFRPKERLQVTRESLVDKFVPTTKFEKEINEALNEAGQADEEAIIAAEEKALQDDLGANDISLEDYKKRRGQLAKMRALMFYHEQKRHHMNKIKSRKYRKIRKKQKGREDDAEKDAQLADDPTLAQELQEKEETERIQERMSLAHKNTSKWAKRILKRGKNVDVETRRALSAQLQRGDDLLSKMKSTRKANDNEESDTNDDDILKMAQQVLASADGVNELEDQVKSKGLMQMSFMKKGIEQQREKAKEEARQLLMEIDQASLELEYHPDAERASSARKTKAGGAKAATDSEMKQILKDGELIVSSATRGNSFAVRGAIAINLGPSPPEVDPPATSEYGMSVPRANVELSNNQPTVMETLSPPKKHKAHVDSHLAINPDEANPWMMPNDRALSSSKDKGQTFAAASFVSTTSTLKPGVIKNGVVDVMGAVDLLQSPENPWIQPSASQKKELKGSKTDRKITSFSQEELVQRAFAAPLEQEINDEFAKEKSEMEEREDNPTGADIKKKKRTNLDMDVTSGWGSWAGEGASDEILPRQKKIPRGMEPPPMRHKDTCIGQRNRKDAKKPNVILSEKRIKATSDKYMISQIPYPFTSREEYERSMLGAIGKEWNVTSSVKDFTRPDVATRAGKIIQPISIRLKQKQKRPAAKF